MYKLPEKITDMSRIVYRINAHDCHQLWLRFLTYLLYLVYKCTRLSTTVAQVVYLLIVYKCTRLLITVAQVVYLLTLSSV